MPACCRVVTKTSKGKPGWRADSRVVGPSRGRLDVLLQEVQQGDGVSKPVGQGVVVLLLVLDLPAHSVDDLVEELSAVRLEDLPLEAAPEDDQRSNRPSVVVAQGPCTATPLNLT